VRDALHRAFINADDEATAKAIVTWAELVQVTVEGVLTRVIER
jgi:hypothetical protein